MTDPEPLPAPSTTRPLRPRKAKSRVRSSTAGAMASRRPTAGPSRSHTYPPDQSPTTQQPLQKPSRPSMDTEPSFIPAESLPKTPPPVQPLFDEGGSRPADQGLQRAVDHSRIAPHVAPIEILGSEAARNASARKRKRPSIAEKRAVAARVGESLADAEEGLPSTIYPQSMNALDSEDEELTVRTSLRTMDEEEFEVGLSRPRLAQTDHGAGAGDTLPSFADSFSEPSWQPGSSTSFSLPLPGAGPSGSASWHPGSHAYEQPSRGHPRSDTSPFDLNAPYDPVGFDAPIDFHGGNGTENLRSENMWRIHGRSAAAASLSTTSRNHISPHQGGGLPRHNHPAHEEEDDDITLISPTAAARLHFSASVPPHTTSPKAKAKAKAKARAKEKDKAKAPALETQSLPISPPAPPTPPTGAGEPLHTYTCPICLSPPTNATLTPCGHILCGECLFTAVNTAVMRTGVGGLGARCPVCRAGLPGWDGRGGGVVGLNMRVMISL